MQWLGQQISKHVSIADVAKRDSLLLYLLPDPMVLHFNVLGATVKN